MFADRIIAFGERFRNRLEDMYLEDAFDYVEHSEEGIAFESICDYLSECNISLSTEEYDELMKLAADMELDLNRGCLKYLKTLIR